MLLKDRILEYKNTDIPYREIARRVGCAPSSVRRYLGSKNQEQIHEKYGENHPYYHQLKNMIDDGYRLKDIVAYFSKHPNTIRRWLKACSLNIPDIPYCCQHCGITDKEKFYHYKTGKRNKKNCISCHNQGRAERFRQQKIEGIKYKGGKCERCGYNRNYTALEFHHINPDEKDGDFNRSRGWSWDRFKEEIDKCELLCANCHRETHNPDCLL